MIRVNLLGDRHFKDRLIIRQQFVIAFVLLLASFVFCFLWYQERAMKISSVEGDIKTANAELASLKKVRAQVDQLEAYARKVAQILKSIEFLKKIQTGPAIYLDHLNVLLPNEIWLTSITDSGGGVAVNGFSFSNNAVAKLMKNLQKSGEFISVELKGITKAKLQGKQEEEGLMQFTISCSTKLGARLAEAEEQSTKNTKGKR